VTVPDQNTPPLDQLADEHDQDGWDRAKHGSFADYATPDDETATVDADEYLRGLDA
jgi:hypothetical protein